MFSTREIATGIWLIPLSLWLLSKPSIRTACGHVLKSFTHRKIATILLLMLAYTALVTAALYAFGIWNLGLLKDSVLWILFSAIAMLMNFVTSRSGTNLFKAILADNLKAMLLLEFLVNAYCFPLLGEIIFVPVMTMIALLSAFAELKEEHRQVATLTKGILGVTGFVLLGMGVLNAITDFKHFATADNLRAFILPPLMSILFSPFLYAASLYATYDDVFLRLRLGREKPKELVAYGRRQIFWHFGIRLGRLQRFLADNPLALMQARTEEDINRLLANSSRPKVSSDNGAAENTSAEIVGSILVPFRSAANGEEKQMVITTWKNTGETPIRAIEASFVGRDERNQVIGKNDYTLYAAFDSEPGVAPGDVFTTPDGEGFVFPFANGKLAGVEVQIISASEWSGM